jgi:hypothetical protein
MWPRSASVLDALCRRDAPRARRLWEQKMDAAADYMLRQIEHSTFRLR